MWIEWSLVIWTRYASNVICLEVAALKYLIWSASLQVNYVLTYSTDCTAASLHDDAERVTHRPARLIHSNTIRHLWQAFNLAAIKARRLFVHKYPLLSVARYSITDTSELEQGEMTECATSSNQQHHEYPD